MVYLKHSFNDFIIIVLVILKPSYKIKHCAEMLLINVVKRGFTNSTCYIYNFVIIIFTYYEHLGYRIDDLQL